MFDFHFSYIYDLFEMLTFLLRFKWNGVWHREGKYFENLDMWKSDRVDKVLIHFRHYHIFSYKNNIMIPNYCTWFWILHPDCDFEKNHTNWAIQEIRVISETNSRWNFQYHILHEKLYWVIYSNMHHDKMLCINV